MQINNEVLYELILSFWVCIARHAQIPKIRSLQYLQKNMGDEVDFLPADKHESLIHCGSITLGVHSQTCPKYPI